MYVYKCVCVCVCVLVGWMVETFSFLSFLFLLAFADDAKH